MNDYNADKYRAEKDYLNYIEDHAEELNNLKNKARELLFTVQQLEYVGLKTTTGYKETKGKFDEIIGRLKKEALAPPKIFKLKREMK